MSPELMVSGLTPGELAERHRDSGDVITRALAMHIIDHDIGEKDYEAEADGLHYELESALSDKDDAEEKVGDLTNLLEECISALGEDDADLVTRIQAVLKACA